MNSTFLFNADIFVIELLEYIFEISSSSSDGDNNDDDDEDDDDDNNDYIICNTIKKNIFKSKYVSALRFILHSVKDLLLNKKYKEAVEEITIKYSSSLNNSSSSSNRIHQCWFNFAAFLLTLKTRRTYLNPILQYGISDHGSSNEEMLLFNSSEMNQNKKKYDNNDETENLQKITSIYTSVRIPLRMKNL
jgi:hypothetical protein